MLEICRSMHASCLVVPYCFYHFRLLETNENALTLFGE